MKKKIIIAIISFLLGAIVVFSICYLLVIPLFLKQQTVEPTPTGTHPSQHSVFFEAGIWEEKDWDCTYATYLGDAVPTSDAAVDVACSVLCNIDWGKKAIAHVPHSVFFDTEDNVWIVYFSLTDDVGSDAGILGGGYFIAIQKTDGKVLRIFADQ